MRFRKSLKLAPGVRMNFSGSGVSWTLGPRGASVNVGKRGTFLNSAIPGTGFSSRARLSGSAAPARDHHASSASSIELTIAVMDDGTLTFRDTQGNPVSQQLVDKAKKQCGDVIRGLIHDKCAEINQQIESVGEIHLDTPDPKVRPTYIPQDFHQPPPQEPAQRKPSWFGRYFKSTVRRIERENAEALRGYELELKNWQEAKTAFDVSELTQRQLIEETIYTDVVAMERWLEMTLASINWPRETNIAFELHDAGHIVVVEVDLPEVEEMPNKAAAAPARGYKLSLKGMSEAKVRKLYMQHVHGLGFRIVGEVFAALPLVRTVILSGYSQRTEGATGRVRD